MTQRRTRSRLTRNHLKTGHRDPITWEEEAQARTRNQQSGDTLIYLLVKNISSSNFQKEINLCVCVCVFKLNSCKSSAIIKSTLWLTRCRGDNKEYLDQTTLGRAILPLITRRGRLTLGPHKYSMWMEMGPLSVPDESECCCSGGGSTSLSDADTCHCWWLSQLLIGHRWDAKDCWGGGWTVGVVLLFHFHAHFHCCLCNMFECFFCQVLLLMHPIQMRLQVCWRSWRCKVAPKCRNCSLSAMSLFVILKLKRC